MIEVKYIDHMGSDLSVVNAARVSFNNWSNSFDMSRERNIKLIKYLAKHKHMSPFGHCFDSFYIKAPIFVARQLVKHKFLRWNEISRCYVETQPTYYYPDKWRGRSEDKKQGSTGEIDLSAIKDTNYNNAILGSGTLDGHVIEISEWLFETYKLLIDKGVAPEQARMVLPQSTMTEFYWSGSLDAFSDMCILRCAEDSQVESRMVADQISNKMRDLFPVSWKELMNE